jgi:hypothetical protein
VRSRQAPYILLILLSLYTAISSAQKTTFRENGKWGITEGGKVIIPATYDTIFNFDSTGKVCLACSRSKGVSSSKFIKVTSTNWTCNYLNAHNDKLRSKTTTNDTCTVFSLSKNSVKQYNNMSRDLVVSLKGEKHVVGKDFRQKTFRGYREISAAPDPSFYIAEILDEVENVRTGLVDLQEKEIVPFRYTNIKMNTADSLIIACAAGTGSTADDIYTYDGKRKASYSRHVDLATKKFIVHKMYEPKEHYVIFNIETKEEKTLSADEVNVSDSEHLTIKVKGDLFLYDMRTNQKKPVKQS